MADEDEIDVLGDFDLLNANHIMRSDVSSENSTYLQSAHVSEVTQEEHSKHKTCLEDSSGQDFANCDDFGHLEAPADKNASTMEGKEILQKGNPSKITETRNQKANLYDNLTACSIEDVIAAVSTGKPTISENCKELYRKNHDKQRHFYIRKHLQGKSHFRNVNSTYENKKAKRAESTQGPYKCAPLINKRGRKKNTTKNSNERYGPQKSNALLSKEKTVSNQGGEEIVKIENIENDIEIDVDLSENEEINSKDKETSRKLQTLSKDTKSLCKQNPCIETPTRSVIIGEHKNEKQPNLSTLDEETFSKITSYEVPKCEMIVANNYINELEKVINWDYFDGRSSKTPQKYLKIRTHIINLWLAQKPKYLHKSAIQQTVKKGMEIIDVERIYQFLEQVGIINFGCEEVRYSRPLLDIIYKELILEKNTQTSEKNCTRPPVKLSTRQRINRKFLKDGEGGFTLTHDEKGGVIFTTVVSEEPILFKHKLNLRKPSVRLMYCRPFTLEKPQPYSIKIHLSALLSMDFHAHLSSTEVMGLVAGYWIPQENSIQITHYEACFNVASSTIHCDMCPISQAKAADYIHEMGLNILGWFHSHPTFAPEPSQQDLDTQQSVQQWIGHSKPCLGLILSPFISNVADRASPFRCLMVDEMINSGKQLIPYKYEVEILAEDFNHTDFQESLKKAKNIVASSKNGQIKVISSYFLDSSITHLEKLVSSVSMHLKKCKNIKRVTCESIIQTIKDLF